MIDLSNAKFGDEYKAANGKKVIIHMMYQGFFYAIMEGNPEHLAYDKNGRCSYNNGDKYIVDVWSDEPQPKFITVMTSRGDMNVFFEGDDVITKDVKGCEICRGHSFIHLVQQMKKNLSIIVIDSAQVVDTKMKEIGIGKLLV